MSGVNICVCRGGIVTKIVFILLSRGNGDEIDHSRTFKELEAQLAGKVRGILKDVSLPTLSAQAGDPSEGSQSCERQERRCPACHL